MRPLRILISLSTSVVAVTLLLYLALGSTQDETTEASSGHVTALFSFTSPGSLFPPSAIISLTDDNSTFFLARPAAFGPDLPKDGLSGPLWIGSGFGDEALRRGGELGCSDVPGWDDADDGLAEARASELPSRISSTHADIQSLQESAEITGKVVLLKRGGCGFLAKVQWAQRRGGTAVIVGDDVRGGALVRMYAKGDTSNITIPALFTSHTTAHLLSSLVPSEDSTSKDRISTPQGQAEHHPSTAINGQEKSHQSNTPLQSDSSSQSDRSSSASSHDTSMDAHNGILHFFLSFLGSDSTGGRKSISIPPAPLDDFVIGEQDWRDFNLIRPSVSSRRSKSIPTTTSSPSVPSQTSSLSSTEETGHDDHEGTIGGKRNTDSSLNKSRMTSKSPAAHDGLWVTLTPTTVSSSPFFDTLLVLVVSPLVTLTVVYVLLLLRSRIRRRRWRAPKSVVERLPVRTYQTMSDSSSSAASGGSSPTTPLLQRNSGENVTDATSAENSAEPSTSAHASAVVRDREEEKRESGLAAWRRRYGGRQKECVVCLEEYVDGVSQVMSLPCGHEFHVGCITPWLVTRRRTCPICKGDVVRSLSQSYHDRLRSPSPTRPGRAFSDDRDIQSQAAETRNESPLASRPVPISQSAPANYSPLDDPENGWANSGPEHSPGYSRMNAGAEVSGSLRNLSSTVTTAIWRGFDAVRNTASLPRRTVSHEDTDRDR